jgi:hypothetical protein
MPLYLSTRFDALLRHGEEFGTCNAHRKKMYPLADNRMVRYLPYLHTYTRLLLREVDKILV